ncbi:MAG: methyltransferase domain-containing protein [Methylobacteriaceae bacterium]|nr:methyltransferase domain-containing protein [Methylobacteriaceae bacterium]
MDQTAPTSPNADQITYWNARAGNTWASLQKRLDTQIGPIGLKAIDTLAPRAGERVIDIGCGCGTTSFEIARRVGTSGHVTAVDISRPMLDVARGEAERDRVRNVEFLEADAQTHGFAPGSFDALFSRFGIMFFIDPVAAFKNLLSALKPKSGRLAFVCWRQLKENPWMGVPVKAGMQHLPPQEPPDPLAPGPFAFADAERVKRILAEAGFSDIAAKPQNQQVELGRLDDAVELCTRVGALSRLVLEYPDAAEPVATSVREALAPHVSEGVVRMDSAVWVFTARR